MWSSSRSVFAVDLVTWASCILFVLAALIEQASTTPFAIAPPTVASLVKNLYSLNPGEFLYCDRTYYLYSLDPGEYLYCDHTCICTHLTLVSTFTVTIPVSVLTQPC